MSWTTYAPNSTDEPKLRITKDSFSEYSLDFPNREVMLSFNRCCDEANSWKKYYERYLDSGKRVTLVGVAFDHEKRNIGEHKVEVIG